MTSRERKVQAMHELAYELGFFCLPGTTYLVDLATRTAAHMKNRMGKVVYQAAAFSMEHIGNGGSFWGTSEKCETCVRVWTVPKAP